MTLPVEDKCMVPRFRLIAIFLLAACSASFAQSLEDILVKHIAARGGAEKLAAMKTFRQTGELQLGPEQKAVLTMAYKRPNLMRMEMMIPGMTPAVRAYDGKHAWVFMPQLGKTKPEPADPATVQEIEEEADFPGPLVNGNEKGHKLELLGREKINDKDCYKIQVTRAGTGDKREYYLDPDTFLEVRVTGRQTNGSFTQDVSDNRAVDGLTFPFVSKVEVITPSGQKQRYTFKIDKIEINPDLPDEQFKMPTTMPSK
jgi:outer membrane lipoprotein-sorting protein